MPWPDWVTGVPSLDQRVTLTIATPVDAGGAGTSTPPTVAPSAAPSAKPGASDGVPASEPVPSAG